jgi:hypothetical protein
VPGAAVPAFTFSIELLPAVTDPGLSKALAPLGTPETVRLTVAALPETTVVEIVLDPFAPCTRLKLAGLGEIEKSLLAGPHPANLNEPMRVFQLDAPLAGTYWFVYQKVQSSLGSMAIAL